MWIEVTSTNSGKVFLINLDLIESIFPRSDGGAELFGLDEDTMYIVEEDYRTIKRMIRKGGLLCCMDKEKPNVRDVES